jgi:flagellin
MSVIGTNIGALRAANASTNASNALSTSMQRLSTGKRINSAKDDAAGLAIGASMTSQIRGMNQGIRNANDGISMVQKTNGTYSADDKTNITTEQDALAKQISSVIANTSFNGKNLFSTATNTIKIQAGAESADAINITFSELDATTSDMSKIVDFTNTKMKSTGTNPVVDPALDDFDSAITAVATERAKLGATQNQLQSAVNNLTSNSTNLSDAKSRIEDADFSAETTALAKAQILSQASTAMLSQANQSQQSVLKLLQ